MQSVADLRYLHLPSDCLPPMLESVLPFKAVVVIEQDVSAAWQAQVSDWLVSSGCSYMMAWGRGCSDWDDSVDYANLQKWDFGEIPDEALIMTTWHDDERLADAFWFSEHCGSHPQVSLDRTLIIHISADAQEAEMLGAYAAAQEPSPPIP